MTDQAALRAQLEQLRDELTARIEGIKADKSGGLDADSKEQAQQLENRDVLNALAAEGADELAHVKAALRRLDEGTYGTCDECGSEIDSRRLEARPYAARCIVCASAWILRCFKNSFKE